MAWDLLLLRERTPEGVAERLGAFAKDRTGAVESALWLVGDNGRFQMVGGTIEQAGRREDLGFEALPVVGSMEFAPPPWRGRRAYAAFPIASGESVIAILALGFEGPAPNDIVQNSTVQDSDLGFRLALAAAALERHLLGTTLANAGQVALERVGAGLAHTLGNVLQAAIANVDNAQASNTQEAWTSLVEASDALKRASAIMNELATLTGAYSDPQSAQISTVSTGGSGEPFCVLVADDEPAVLRGVQRLLATAGHRVCAVRDGVEAMAVARRSNTIDVALVDLTMPNLSGPPLVAALREILPNAPVVVMTGYASDEMVEALRSAGAAAVLKKPIAGEGLMEALSRAVEKQRASAIQGGQGRSSPGAP